MSMMETVDNVKRTWQETFKCEIPAQFITRLECMCKQGPSSEGLIQKLTALSNQTKESISELSKKIKEEEFFLEVIMQEMEKVSKASAAKPHESSDPSALYAKVNKPKVKQANSFSVKVQKLPSGDQFLDTGYEDVVLIENDTNDKEKESKVKSNRGSVKDKIKMFEQTDSSSDESADGDYARLKIIQPPATRRKPRDDDYEDIDLPCLKPPGSTNIAEKTKGSGNNSLHTDKSNTVQSKDHLSNDTQHKEGMASTKPNNIPADKTSSAPPVPMRRSHGKGKGSIRENATNKDAKKPEVTAPKKSEQEPTVSSVPKKVYPSDGSAKISAKVIHVNAKIDVSDQDDDYCSIKELADMHKGRSAVEKVNKNSDKEQPESDGVGKQGDIPVKNVTVLHVQSSNRAPDRGLSKSTENLSDVSKSTNLNEQSKQYLSKSTENILDNTSGKITFGESEMKKLMGKRKEGSISSKKDIETPNEVKGTSYKPLDENGSNENLLQTVPIDITQLGMDIEAELEKPKRQAKERRRKKVPDYEKWNFNALLTKDGISAADEQLTDVGSDDDVVLYDNISDAKQENVSGQSDDSGVCEASSPDDKPKTDKNSDDTRSQSINSEGSRISNASCMTVDGGDQVFLNRVDTFSAGLDEICSSNGGDDERLTSLEDERLTSIEDDTFSICSQDDQLDKADFEETLTPESGMKYNPEQMRMRHLVVKGILESEKSYLHVIEQLIKAKHYLQSMALTQHSLAGEDVTTIFYKLDDIFKIHKDFIEALEDKIQSWSEEQCIADAVKQLVVYFKAYEEYVQNYNTAVKTIRKYQQNEETKHLLEEQLETFKDETIKLEDILLKPVQRIQTNNLVLHDLIKHTPENHPDYLPLMKALKLSEGNLKTYNEQPGISCNKIEESRHLVKSGFVVEVSRDRKSTRQLRYMFLFSDILVCTKFKGSRHKEVSFKYVWSLPVANISIHVKVDQKYTQKESLEELKHKIGTLKLELRDEMVKADQVKDKAFSISQKRALRNIEKLKKKIQEQEATLVEALPRLPLNIEQEGCRPHTFLFPTDYEREEWREALDSQSSKCLASGSQPPQLSTHDLEVLISSTKLHTQVNGIGTAMLRKDEEMLSGSLNVTIHKMQGLTGTCDVYCCLEMDSYGHFYKKAQTRTCKHVTDASWDQDFELELDGSQTLRILCYREKQGDCEDEIIGKCALELSLAWLNSKFNEKTITMNDISLTISIRHTPASKTLKRTQSKLKVGIFGVKIESVVKRECKTVPTIVTTCVQQVELRGMDEVGIYRVSGVTSDVQHCKNLFDKNPIAADAYVDGADIHAITGVLKLYFRELPEPLFTDKAYQTFVKTIELQNAEAKEKCMLELLHSLPEANYYTIVYMIEHLVRVAQRSSVNKMSVNNLATIFGPTLLHPAVKDTPVDPMIQMIQAAKDASVQSEVVLFFLKLALSGKNLRKSAATETS